MTIEAITAYIEHENAIMYRNHGRPDNIDGFVCDAISTNLDNSSARLLLSYLENREGAKLRELLVSLLEKEYGEKAEEFAREQERVARDEFFKSVANGSW